MFLKVKLLLVKSILLFFIDIAILYNILGRSLIIDHSRVIIDHDAAARKLDVL